MISKELTLLIKLAERLYKKAKLPNVRVNEIDIDEFIKLASNNNLLFFAAQQIINIPSLPEEMRKRFQLIVSEGGKDIEKVRRSLDTIKELLPHTLIFKTFRGTIFPRIPNDIDVITRSFQEDFDKFVGFGYEPFGYLPKEGSAQFLKDDMCKIHLHSKISWAWTEFFDSALIYENPRIEIFNGCEITIPNINADVLIHIAHMNFEPLLMNLSELLYLFNLISQINLDIILEQSKKYNWQGSFVRTLNLINNFHLLLYGELLCDKIEFKNLKINKIAFPYVFSRKHMILSCFEKRLFIYPLTKAFKVFKIMFSKDAYRYIESPEREIIK